MGEEKREIVLKVSAEVAGYFKRRKLIANQVIEKELEDGGLLVSAKVGHLNQVLPIVRYWIPHLRVISPEGLQAELERELTRYVEFGRGRWGARTEGRGRHENAGCDAGSAAGAVCGVGRGAGLRDRRRRRRRCSRPTGTGTSGTRPTW